MSNDSSNTLQLKIDELEELLKKQIDSINEIDDSLKTINNNRASLFVSIKEISAALTAYKESLRLIKGPQLSAVVHELEPVD